MKITHEQLKEILTEEQILKLKVDHRNHLYNQFNYVPVFGWQNITGCYFLNEKKVPFIVRRENWTPAYGLLVLSVKPKKTKNGWYGVSIGHALPPLNGFEMNDYWGKPAKPKEINCSGCGQWRLMLDPIPNIWKEYLTKKSEYNGI